MAKADEAYAYQIIRAAALADAADATTRREKSRCLQIAGFAQRSARLIGATA